MKDEARAIILGAYQIFRAIKIVISMKRSFFYLILDITQPQIKRGGQTWGAACLVCIHELTERFQRAEMVILQQLDTLLASTIEAGVNAIHLPTANASLKHTQLHADDGCHPVEGSKQGS
jgi:hypothetical protein